MDDEFGPPAMAIVLGDLDELTALLRVEPALATRRSSTSHPTLLQLIACEAANLPSPVDAARVLIGAGADVDQPLAAAAGCSALEILDLLLDEGADIDGGGTWTALDEALYWDKTDIAAHLLERGAAVRALSTAAGLGTVGRLDRFFNDGDLSNEAGPIGSPFADTVPEMLASDPQSILDHAFVMAVNTGQRATAEIMLAHGAIVNAKPPGFHWRGTALHTACWRGDAEIVTWLLDEGADPTVTDDMVNSDASGWANHHGHDHLVELLATPGRA